MTDRVSIRPVSDGYYAYPHPRELLFPGVGGGELMAAGGPGGNWKHWKSPYAPTLIQDGMDTILVDAGAGDLVPTAGLLFDNLNQAGVAQEDVDVVVITHLHPDHVAGMLCSGGRPVFPNARILLSKTELAFWSGKPGLDELKVPPEIKEMIRTTASRFLERYSSRIEGVSMDARVTTHVRLFAAQGHTPGHMGVEVRNGDALTLVVGDAFLHPVHIANPQWTASADMMPEATIRTRRRILERMRKESATILGFHLPAQGRSLGG